MATYQNPLSPSSINRYVECPYKFYLKYIKHIKFESGDAGIFGSYIHKINEDFWPYYVSIKDSQQAMKESIEKNKDTKIDDEYIDISKTCVDNFLSIVGETPDLIPIYLEYKALNETNNTVAIIDVVYPHKIVDYKTSTQYTKKPKESNIIQAVMCSENLRHCTGMDIKLVEFQYLRFKKYQYVDITPSLVGELYQLIDQVRIGIKSDRFPKNNKACWFCDYKLICDAEDRAIKQYQKRTENRKCSKLETSSFQTNLI